VFTTWRIWSIIIAIQKKKLTAMFSSKRDFILFFQKIGYFTGLMMEKLPRERYMSDHPAEYEKLTGQPAEVQESK